jgi:predicted aldo/keto reductase-like oxidoreductase
MSEKSLDYTRRGFLSAAFSGLLSAGLLGISPRTAISRGRDEKEEKPKKKVIYRKLGKTDISIPIVSMGVMNSDNPEVVRASYEIGIRHFDSAAYYHGGRNEEMVGSVIKELGVRDEVVIATKIFDPSKRKGLGPEQYRDKIVAYCEESLKRLDTEYIDILYIHVVDSAEFARNEEVAAAMTQLKKQGKARYIGLSTHRNMHEVIKEAARTGIYDCLLTVFNFALQDHTELIDAIRKAASKGIGIIAMKTQAGSHQWARPEIGEKYDSATAATAALKWVLRNENITTAVPGYTTFEHMREDFSVASGLEYTEQEKKLLAENEIRMGMGFCRQCQLCLGTCPGGVDIPTLMRTHMYAVQYGNFHHARATLGEIPRELGLGICASCSHCSAICANRVVDVARRIADLKLIYA